MTQPNYPGKRIVGTCSLCAGAVTAPIPPPKDHFEIVIGAPEGSTCETCGATAVGPHGPVVAMCLPPVATSAESAKSAERNRVDELARQVEGLKKDLDRGPDPRYFSKHTR